MSQLVTFTDRSPRYALPFLLPGQGQKEFFVNEGLARADLLHHCAVSGSAITPPSAPVAGETWRVASGAGGVWTGHDDALAGWQGESWIFVAPQDGMRIWDAAAGQFALYRGSWAYPDAPALRLGRRHAGCRTAHRICRSGRGARNRGDISLRQLGTFQRSRRLTRDE